MYIDSKTLWEMMQEIGGKGKHNYHGLNVFDVFNALKSIKNPQCIFEKTHKVFPRYSILTSCLSHFNEYVLVVIEVDSLLTKTNIKSNKIITLYPKTIDDNYLKSKNIRVLYKKK